jgi:hypothetical protein
MRRAAARHGVSNLRLFDSTARGDDRPDSDIDLLVHLDRQLGLIGLAPIRRELEDVLGVPVDVMTDYGLKARRAGGYRARRGRPLSRSPARRLEDILLAFDTSHAIR